MGGTRVEAGQRPLTTSRRDEKTDSRNGPRGCIVIALIIIAIIAINLARHSTPCYEFFKTPGGITLLTGIPVIGIAMIIFWPKGKPKEDKKAPPSHSSLSQSSRLSNPPRFAITASAPHPPSVNVVSPAFVIFKEWPFSRGEDGLFDMTEEEAGQIALQLGEDEYFIYKSRDVYGYRTKDLNYTSRVIETRANSRRVYPAPSNRAFDLFCSMNFWKYSQFDIRRDRLDNVVALSQEEVDKLERFVKNPPSIIPFYLRETREKSGYSALSPSGRLPLYKSLKELDKALSVHGSCLQLQRKASFGIGDIQFTDEKLLDFTDPPTLFDDEIERLKAGFLRGYFDNWTYLYYSTLSGKMKRMAIIDRRLRNEEVENLEQDRRQMTHANMSELFLRRIEPGFCLWDLDSNSKPSIILSESEVIKLRKKLPDERSFFIVKNVKTLMFELHTKGRLLRAEKREELLKPTGDDWTKYYPKQVVPREGIGLLSLRAFSQKPAGYDVNLPRLSTCAAYYLSSLARDPLIGFYYRDINRDKVVFIQNGMQDVLEDKTIAQHRALRAANIVEVYAGEGIDES